MIDGLVDGQATPTGDRYHALLAISEAIISHRDLSSLFHDLAGQLGRVAQFDYLALVLREDTMNTMGMVVDRHGTAVRPTGIADCENCVVVSVEVG